MDRDAWSAAFPHRVGHHWSDQAVAAAHEGISLECLLGCQYHWLAWATIHFPWLPQHSFVPPLDFSIIDFIIQHRWNICHALAHCHWVTKSWTAFVTPRTASRQTSLSFTIAQSWRLNCTLGFCRGITNGHRTQNIHIHTYIYIHTYRERERQRLRLTDFKELAQRIMELEKSQHPQSAKWRPRRADSAVPVQKLSGLRPKKSVFQFEPEDWKTEKSSSRQSSSRSFLLRGECPFGSIQVFAWMRSTHLGEGNLLNSGYPFKYSHPKTPSHTLGIFDQISGQPVIS